MRKIGTFFITAAMMAGAAMIVPAQGTQFMNTVYASSTDAEEESAEIDGAVVITTTNNNSNNGKVYYYATPKLVVTGREIKGDAVKAGEEFEMTIHLKNESNSTRLRNISVKLSSEDNQIITTSGSDSIYIDNLDKEAECEITVKMKAREDLEQKNYTVNVDYNYEDNSKNTFEGSACVTVPVEQEARLGISEVKLSKSELDVDGKTSLSFKVNNMGLDTLRNITVEFSGDTIKEVSYYAGTVESGASGNVDMTITPDKVGNDDINIKVTFEDASGNVSTFEDTVPLLVNEAEPEVAEAVEEPAVSPAILGGGAVAVIILISLVAGIIKKLSQKKYE